MQDILIPTHDIRTEHELEFEREFKDIRAQLHPNPPKIKRYKDYTNLFPDPRNTNAKNPMKANMEVTKFTEAHSPVISRIYPVI